MPRCAPPVEHRWSATNPPPHILKKGPYLTPLLRKLVEKKITIEDPTLQKLMGIEKLKKLKLKYVIMLRYISNACKGDNQAIEGILNRLDGKIDMPLIDNSTHYHLTKIEGDELIAEAKRRGIPIPEEITRGRGDTREVDEMGGKE